MECGRDGYQKILGDYITWTYPVLAYDVHDPTLYQSKRNFSAPRGGGGEGSDGKRLILAASVLTYLQNEAASNDLN